MTPWNNYVDQAPDIDSARDFGRWAGESSPPKSFEPPRHRALRYQQSEGFDNAVSSAITLPVPQDPRRDRLVDRLFLPAVRRNVVVFTTFAVLGFGIWLVASELAAPTNTAIDNAVLDGPAIENLPDSQVATSGAVSSESAAPVDSADAITLGSVESQDAVEPTMSSDGRVAVNLTSSNVGWTATVSQIQASGESSAVAVRALIDGHVVAESSTLPLEFDIDVASSELAAVIVSAVVDWSGDEPSSPVAVVVSTAE